MYINKKSQLDDLCLRLRGVRRLAVDVEFMRERTYYPILALVQVASEDICAAIDVLAIDSLTPLYEILHDPKTEKIFHAAKQDLEICYLDSKRPARNIFDTQIAAALVGLGAQISLSRLVETVTGVHLDKAETYTDWTRRPLSDSQIAYALDDVRYMLPCHDFLLKEMKELGREEWPKEDFSRLEDPALYEPPNPENQYKKMKGIRGLKRRNLSVMRELAAWRELAARTRDRTLNSVMREESILVLSKQTPATIKELHQIRGIHANEIKRSGPAILEAIKKGLSLPEDQRPALPPSNGNGLPGQVEGLLWVFTQHRAKSRRISATCLASRKEIRELATLHARGDSSRHPLLNGWKMRLVGKDLLAILEGKALVGADPRTGELKLVRKERVG